MRQFLQRVSVPAGKENTFFWLIILIASTLRFYNYCNWSYSHDELSQLVRLRYDSFSELISKGVRTDVHPAFTQVFLYCWTNFLGEAEAVVRLPFVLAGIGSVWLTYVIGKKWFGFATACFSSLTLAILDFPILYSQVSRPYSFGLFFSLLAVWCWTNLLFQKKAEQAGSEKKTYLTAVFYGIATALCMFTHYFAFFFAMIVATTGFLFLKKETWKPYLFSGIIAVVIFLPHIPISLHQIRMGGVGEWLGKPESDYLWKFILYGFNDSQLVIISVAILFLLSILIYHIDILISKFHFVCIAWFLLPFAAGYYYSVNVNPVLQYSTLLFSFPFLPMLLFSFFPKGTPSEQGRNKKLNLMLLASAGIVFLYSTIIEQRFYRRECFGVFKEINQAVVELQKKYKGSTITTVLNTSGKDIMNFYFERWNENIPYDFYAGDDPLFVSDMLRKMDACTTDYFLYGWSNFRSPYEIPELIKRKFPCIIYDEKHFNSQITLFGKNDSCKRDTIFYSHSGFESPLFSLPSPQGEGPGVRRGEAFDSTKIDTTHFHFGKHSLNIESTNEFCITLQTNVKNIFSDNNVVNIGAWIFPTDTFNGQMVMDIGDKTGNEWRAILLGSFIKSTGKWQEVFATFELPASVFPDDEVKIYLWNPGKNSFYLDDFSVSSFTDSRYNYYAPSFRK